MAAGARNPGVDFLEDQILLPKAFPSLPASFSLCVSFSLSALYGSKLAGVGLGRGCQRKSDGMWERTGDGKCGFCLVSPGLAFPTLGWPCLSPGPQHLSVAHLPAVTLAQANHFPPSPEARGDWKNPTSPHVPGLPAGCPSGPGGSLACCAPSLPLHLTALPLPRFLTCAPFFSLPRWSMPFPLERPSFPLPMAASLHSPDLSLDAMLGRDPQPALSGRCALGSLTLAPCSLQIIPRHLCYFTGSLSPRCRSCSPVAVEDRPGGPMLSHPTPHSQHLL